MEQPREPPVHPRSGRICLDHDDGVETLEVALIGVLVMIAILIAFPLLLGGIGSALGDVTAALQNVAAGIE